MDSVDVDVVAVPLQLRKDTTAVITLVVYITFPLFSFIFVGLQVWTRARLMRAFGIDDVLICIGWLFAFWTCIAIFYDCVQAGLGQHLWNLSQDQIRLQDAILLQLDWTHTWALIFVRLSILTLYLRFWRTLRIRYVCYAFIGINVCWGVAAIVVDLTTCTPISRFWDPDVPGQCRDPKLFWIITGALNAALDVAMFALPLPILKSIVKDLKKEQWIGIMMALSLGICACIAAIIRIPYISTASNPIDPGDYSFESWSVLIWAAIELNLGICGASIPALEALLYKLFPQLLDNSSVEKNVSIPPRIPRRPLRSPAPTSIEKQLETGLAWATTITVPIASPEPTATLALVPVLRSGGRKVTNPRPISPLLPPRKLASDLVVETKFPSGRTNIGPPPSTLPVPPPLPPKPLRRSPLKSSTVADTSITSSHALVPGRSRSRESRASFTSIPWHLHSNAGISRTNSYSDRRKSTTPIRQPTPSRDSRTVSITAGILGGDEDDNKHNSDEDEKLLLVPQNKRPTSILAQTKIEVSVERASEADLARSNSVRHEDWI